MSRTLSQEDYLAEEFGLLGVKPHIMHLRQDPGCAYSVITVAAPEYVPDRLLMLLSSRDLLSLVVVSLRVMLQITSAGSWGGSCQKVGS
jgi:hypothetical protein